MSNPSVPAPLDFEQHTIRRAWHDERWLYSVVDVIAVSPNAPNYGRQSRYWTTLKRRLTREGFTKWRQMCPVEISCR